MEQFFAHHQFKYAVLYYFWIFIFLIYILFKFFIYITILGLIRWKLFGACCAKLLLHELRYGEVHFFKKFAKFLLRLFGLALRTLLYSWMKVVHALALALSEIRIEIILILLLAREIHQTILVFARRILPRLGSNLYPLLFLPTDPLFAVTKSHRLQVDNDMFILITFRLLGTSSFWRARWIQSAFIWVPAVKWFLLGLVLTSLIMQILLSSHCLMRRIALFMPALFDRASWVEVASCHSSRHLSILRINLWFRSLLKIITTIRMLSYLGWPTQILLARFGMLGHDPMHIPIVHQLQLMTLSHLHLLCGFLFMFLNVLQFQYFHFFCTHLLSQSHSAAWLLEILLVLFVNFFIELPISVGYMRDLRLILYGTFALLLG